MNKSSSVRILFEMLHVTSEVKKKLAFMNKVKNNEVFEYIRLWLVVPKMLKSSRVKFLAESEMKVILHLKIILLQFIDNLFPPN